MDKSEKIAELYRIIANLSSAKECQMLFDDLCTKKEIEKMAERIYAAKLLLEGKTYNQVPCHCSNCVDFLFGFHLCYGAGRNLRIQKR